MISVFRSGRVPQPRAIGPIHLHVRVPPSGPPRPEPPEDSGGGIRLRSASGPVVTGAVGLVMAALAAVAVAAPAIDPEPDDKPAVVAEALVEEQTKAAQLLARQDALRGKVRHADVKAPLGGTVSAVHMKTVGAVVQAGTMLVELVPAEAEYLVRAQVLPQNVKDVQPGQVARISLAAYDPSRYGVIMGEVRRVAKNTTQPENAMLFYETIIAIPDVAFTKSPDTPVITAGMPLQVDILGGKRTIMNYIMTPIQKSLATAFREK